MKKHFSGDVKLYNEQFYINTETGEGMPRLLKKIDPLLIKMAKSIYISGYDFDDLKQELSILVLEGLSTFDASKGIKLSSFLHIHLHNKIVSKIKQANRIRRNAFAFKENSEFPKVCECGCDVFYIKKENENKEPVSIQCDSCERVYRKNCRISKREISFSEFREPDSSKDDGKINNIADDCGLYNKGFSVSNSIEVEESITSICNNVDEKTAKILRMIALQDSSIKDAAEEVGITEWAANLRMKSLVKNKYVKEMLGR